MGSVAFRYEEGVIEMCVCELQLNVKAMRKK